MGLRENRFMQLAYALVEGAAMQPLCATAHPTKQIPVILHDMSHMPFFQRSEQDGRCMPLDNRNRWRTLDDLMDIR